MPMIRLQGHSDLAATLQIDRESAALSMTLVNERIDELALVVNRAINCWPDAPPWLFEFTDMIEAARRRQHAQ